MRKKVSIFSGVLLVVMLLSVTAFAKDGATSCTFKGNGGATGVGQLAISSSNFTATSTLKNQTVKVLLNYHYRDSSGELKLGTPSAQRENSAAVSKALPSGTSERKGRSSHQVDGIISMGLCELW